MSGARQALYQRLPEIYRIRDAELFPAGQLRAFLDLLDSVPAALRDNIEALYHDLFIDTCADWVVPYLADLLGTSHLSGDPWTLRADVARTVFHRRRKGTLGAVESLTYALTGWAAEAVELRGNLAWTAHLNHQRPDAGGTRPLTRRSSLAAAVRGGTVSLRDPALLSSLGGPFDPFAHVADFKSGQIGAPRYNLPNLGVFLWRLEDYTVPVADPGSVVADEVADAEPGAAAAVVRCCVHPQGDPMVLFNTHRYRMDDEPPDLSHPDEVPGPIPAARLNSASAFGNPDAYLRVDYYGPDSAGESPVAPGADSPGLVLHLPDAVQPPAPLDQPTLPPAARWRFRGANLCAWEDGLSPPLRAYEIAVDPERGRVLFGLADRATEAEPLAAQLLVSYTYGFSGPTGAHPVARAPLASDAQLRRGDSLETALSAAQLDTRGTPYVLEIQDSATYTLDLALVGGAQEVGGAWSLPLAQSFTLRAASGQRPVIRLLRPLRVHPADLADREAVGSLTVTLEGLYLTWERGAAAFAEPGTALITRAALNLLRIDGCTLDPGGAWQLDGSAQGARHDRRPGFVLDADYGFDAETVPAFDQVPRIELTRSISGAVLAAEDAYLLAVTGSIIDGCLDGDGAAAPLAIGPPPAPDAESDAEAESSLGWGPTLEVSGLTCFGRARVASIAGPDGAPGDGGLWMYALQVHDDQRGCLRYSYTGGVGDRLPPHYGCVSGTEAQLSFTDQRFSMPGYAQLRQRCDPRILEQGPGRDQMGAFGYLQSTHKWKNIGIRFREFMPVDIHPLLIPVT
jgi:hypothetical protein